VYESDGEGEEEISELSEVLMFLAKSAQEKTSRPTATTSSAPSGLPYTFAEPESKTLPPAPTRGKAPAQPSSIASVPVPSVSPPKPPPHERGGRGGGRGGGGYGRGGRGGRGGRTVESEGVASDGEGSGDDKGSDDDDDEWVGLRRKMKKNVSPDGRVDTAATPAVPGFWGAFGGTAVGVTAGPRPGKDEESYFTSKPGKLTISYCCYDYLSVANCCLR
jgi:hypothetical protein